MFNSSSESTSILKNLRTNRAYGYAFIDLCDPGEAERAIARLSGKKILGRMVTVQLARKPELVRATGQAKDTKTPTCSIPSKTTVMISNLPYDLTEEKVSDLWISF